MRKITAAAMALLIAAMPLTACGKTNKTSDNAPSAKTAEERIEETCQEALETMYKATFSQNGAEVCVSYMYPKIVIDHLRSSGRYEAIIEQFNTAQDLNVQNMKHKPEITEFTDEIELTEAQLAAALSYFVAESAEEPVRVGLDPAGIKITKGYELHCNIIDQNGNPDTDDNECVVFIEDDGWKVISVSAEKLETVYSDAASAET